MNIDVADSVAAQVPEPGQWSRAPGSAEHPAVWVRRVDPADASGVGLLASVYERLRHLDHPSIPRPLSFNRAQGVLAVAAPEGIPLQKLFERIRERDPAFVLNPGTLLDLGLQLADVLVHAHERGRPHGHLSPDVVWLTRSGRLVVWGLGVGPTAPCSPRWVAPERARGDRISTDSDQWSVAAILAALVTGRYPWGADDPGADAVEGDLSHLVNGVNRAWQRLGIPLSAALSIDRDARFGYTFKLRHALRSLATSVKQPTKLATFGADLHDRFAAPAPDPSAEPDADADADEPPTRISGMPEARVAAAAPSAPQAVAPPPPAPRGATPVAPVAEDAYEPPTERPTSPTGVPDRAYGVPPRSLEPDPLTPAPATAGSSDPADGGRSSAAPPQPASGARATDATNHRAAPLPSAVVDDDPTYGQSYDGPESLGVGQSESLGGPSLGLSGGGRRSEVSLGLGRASERSLDDAPSVGSRALSGGSLPELDREAPPPEPAAGFDIRQVAPWVVSTFFVLAGLYLLFLGF